MHAAPEVGKGPQTPGVDASPERSTELSVCPPPPSSALAEQMFYSLERAKPRVSGSRTEGAGGKEHQGVNKLSMGRAAAFLPAGSPALVPHLPPGCSLQKPESKDLHPPTQRHGPNSEEAPPASGGR